MDYHIEKTVVSLSLLKASGQPKVLIMSETPANLTKLHETHLATLRCTFSIFVCLHGGLTFQSRTMIFSHVWMKPALRGFNCVLLKDTTRLRLWGANPGPLDSESDVLPLPLFQSGQGLVFCMRVPYGSSIFHLRPGKCIVSHLFHTEWFGLDISTDKI